MSASGKAYDDSNSEASLLYRATQKSPVLKENKIKRKKEKEKKKQLQLPHLKNVLEVKIAFKYLTPSADRMSVCRSWSS